jgi:hypothetical protein
MLAVAPAGEWEVLARYGSMESDIPAGALKAWRDIPVLRRSAG